MDERLADLPLPTPSESEPRASASGRLSRLAWPLALGTALLVLIGVPMLAAGGGDLGNKPINLSKRAEVGLKSADASLKASADGKWVAAVWSRGYDSRPDTAQVGNIVLKSANVMTGWELQVNVFSATASLWAQQPRLAFRPLPQSQSQIAAVWVVCRNRDEQCDTLQWTTCDIARYPDRCQSAQTLHSEANANLSNPDLVYDNTGRLHFIWRKGLGTGNRGLFYRRQGGGVSQVAGTDLNSFNPSLAFGNDRLHLVWYQHHDTPASRRVRYSADKILSDDAWDALLQSHWKAPLLWRLTGGPGEPYVRPSIAAAGNTVYVGWDIYRLSETEGDVFHLAYDHSSDNGASWLTGPGGDGKAVPGAFFSDATSYRSPLDSMAEESALRPSIAVSGSLPAVAWHLFTQVTEGGDTIYVIGYTSGISAGGVISWQVPVIITNDLNYDPREGIEEDHSANPRLAIWPGGRLHIVHLGLWGGNPFDPKSDWDVYYRGAVITDTSSLPTPTRTPGPGTPTATPTRTPKPGGPTPTPTVYPYDDVNRARLPVIRR
jgi:hypothetical protein